MNNQEYILLQETIKDWYENTNDNIVGVGYSYKLTNGQQTDNLCISFSVNNKKDISELSPSEILPKTININGKEYLTDVKQQQLQFFANACYSWEPPDADILKHRTLVKPLKGGISIGPNNEVSAGTMGLICLDNIDRTIVGLTNNHVVMSNGFLNSSRTHYNPNSPISNIKYISSDQSDILQPGKIEFNSTQKIGPIKRYYPLSHNSVNYIDAALVSISNQGLVDNKSYEQMNNTELTYPPVFATTEEINTLLISPKPKLYKSGRTTGFIGGSLCPLEAVSIMETLSVGGYSPYNAQVVFSDTIVYKFIETNTNGRPKGGVSIPGDSGSIVLADFNGVIKVIGLNFAGGSFQNGDPQGNGGVACRIDRLASLLQITHWNGTEMRFSDPSKWKYYEDESNASNATITNNGETYWQIGTI